MMAIGWVTNLIQRGSVSMRRINQILEETPEIVDLPVVRHILGIGGRVEFRGLSVKYPGHSAEAIKDIHLTIERGRTVSIVGRVGSGKTTLLHTIPRLFNTPRGTLFIDGLDVHDIPLKVLREGIGFVTQEAMIFPDTIRNNVLFGRSSISEETLERALKTVQFFDEVQGLENGADTLLGEKGITLSGGQRQRLCVARAFIAEPAILILDDALSMVDTRTEEKILNQILGTRTGKTNFIVSHRLSTISRADLVVVLDRGLIVETGSHGSLVEKGKEYARLYERQLLAQELEEQNSR
jgi:ATP-binding cassette subfamily B multidrug efflux pump